VPGPGQEGAICLEDEAVWADAQVAAGSLLVQRLGVIDEEGLLECGLRGLMGSQVPALRKSFMASTTV
jgi:hypothetical protein